MTDKEMERLIQRNNELYLERDTLRKQYEALLLELARSDAKVAALRAENERLKKERAT